jgi:endo-alpha-1,4-polygalactosaminidase (GH114 family)
VEAGAESVSERYSLLDLVDEYIKWKEKDEKRSREKYQRSKNYIELIK